MDVRIGHDRTSDTTILSLHGQLDIDTATVLVDALEDLHQRDVSRIVVDLAGVHFCDSTGLSALVVGYHRATRAGGYLRLAAPTPFLLRVLTVVGIRDTVPVYRSVAAGCRGGADEIVTDSGAVEPEVWTTEDRPGE